MRTAVFRAAGVAALVLSVLVAGEVAGQEAVASPSHSRSDRPTVTAALPSRAAILAAAQRAENYYRGTYPVTTLTPPNGWSWATYFQGVMDLYNRSGTASDLSDVTAWGSSNSWGVETKEHDPDTVKALSVYYDAHAASSSVPLTQADTKMAADLANLPSSQYDWVDALYMGLPNWTRWSKRTGKSSYFDKMDAFFTYERDHAATSSRCHGAAVPQNGLWSASRGLWYRDCTFVGQLDPNGDPIFWSRGNGWAIAAMAQVLQGLPAGNGRAAKYAAVFTAMAASLRALQGSDGLWRASLLDPTLFPTAETSGTVMITYALAWGINAGLLSSATYLPVVTKAWQGLSTIALQPSGFVSHCQGPGGAPGTSYTGTAPRTAPSATSAGTVNADSPPYCVGGLLLAATQVAQLATS